MYLRPTSPSEILHFIRQLNPNKSVGSDGIGADFGEISAEVISPILSQLCNACFHFGIFPICLKIAKVIPIYKSGDKTNLTNYRPISILSCFSKLSEKTVHSRTIDYLNSTLCCVILSMGFDQVCLQGMPFWTSFLLVSTILKRKI